MPSQMPVGLGERGQSVWDALAGDDVVRNAVVLEAARTADRLDELDNIIQGKGVLNLMQFRVHGMEDDGENRNINVEVKFAAPLAEARQQAMALAGLLKAAGVGEAAEGSKSGAPPATPLEGLMKKLAERQGKAG